MRRNEKKLLGELLVEENIITPQQLKTALREQKLRGGVLGRVLVELDYVSEGAITAFYARYCRIPYVSLLDYMVTEAVLELLPEAMCLKYSILPIDRMGKHLTVAMVNPLNDEALQEVRSTCPGMVIKPILCDWDHYTKVAKRHFSRTTLGYSALFGTKPPSAPVEDAEIREVDFSAFVPSDAVDKIDFLQSTMQNTYRVLGQRVHLFNGVPPEDLAVIFAMGWIHEIPSGGLVFKKGDADSDLYAILCGKVNIVDEGRVLATLSAGEIFGEMAAVTDEPRSATAVASMNSSLFVLTRENFGQMIRRPSGPQILLTMLSTMSRRLREANEKLASAAP